MPTKTNLTFMMLFGSLQLILSIVIFSLITAMRTRLNKKSSDSLFAQSLTLMAASLYTTFYFMNKRRMSVSFPAKRMSLLSVVLSTVLSLVMNSTLLTQFILERSIIRAAKGPLKSSTYEFIYSLIWISLAFQLLLGLLGHALVEDKKSTCSFALVQLNHYENPMQEENNTTKQTAVWLRPKEIAL